MYAFITIITQSANHQPYLSFIKTQERYIINNYKISGDGCYILESRFPSNEELDQFLLDLNRYANYKLSIVINKLG
ncbi:Lrp/AsnC ligand binding domain-containing protein [Bacillus sp. YZJH907-2]|uniref:Lrp/AsnC ligand binding domain-containing protein n=1 Tax=Halalkalibacter suaedae TaxID=2822140 RepID=A0A940WV77_9BACI|nr:Lrp/AsnC ligand binding domain-containing protein [Bacillus suaedae]